uniref:SFRICE_004671 n=1 Tax=Spodoptera frugiperda TaxID=7108 RepID=A0A2H1VIA8_SPOFR
MVSARFATFILAAGLCVSAVLSASQASIEDFPSIAQIETGIGRVWLQTCIGTIITNFHVLTAAHCLVGTALTPRVSRVRVGAEERGRDGDVYAVQSIVRHPDYSFRSFDNNVGILRLQAALTFSSKVQMARITASGLVFPANVPVVLANWGRTAQDVIWSDRDLYSAQLFTVEHSACVERYGSLLLPIEVTDNMVCVSSAAAAGTHFGVRDGGAPIFYDGILVGFVSFGSPYGEKFPVVATGVSPYSDWIVANAV